MIEFSRKDVFNYIRTTEQGIIKIMEGIQINRVQNWLYELGVKTRRGDKATPGNQSVYYRKKVEKRWKNQTKGGAARKHKYHNKASCR